MTFVTRPNLDSRQFKQVSGSTLSLEGETDFIGILKSKGVEIDPNITGDTLDYNEYALVYDYEKNKIVLQEVVARYSGIAERNVGGIREGDEFTEATMSEMWDTLIREEKIPTLVDPSITSFTATETGFREIGAIINSTFNIVFNRGKIEIVSTTYNSFDFRSGEVERYVYSGPSLTVENITNSLTNSTTLTNYEIVSGAQSWNCTVYFGEGSQPTTSYGNTEYYDENTETTVQLEPYPAGSIVSTNRTITGVYPYFATTSNITSLTKRPLAAHGSAVIVEMVAETSSNKQTLEIPNVWGTLSRIEQYNELSGQWDIIDINSFTQSTTTNNINGYTINYNVFTHNGSLIGARRLRFTF
jgi:hypothetical protein